MEGDVEREYQTAQVLQAGMDWLQDNAGRPEPFFLFLDVFHPHEPFFPPPQYLRLYEKTPFKPPQVFPKYGWTREAYSDAERANITALYKAEVTYCDRWIGRLLQTIEDLQLAEKTVVVLTSDHGFFIGERGGLIGKPGILYNEISRIPMIMRHPDMKGGRRTNALVTLADLFPTILESTGTPVPAGIDGKSLLPLTSGNAALREEHCFGGHHGSLGITDGRFTLLNLIRNGKRWWELYADSDEKQQQDLRAGKPNEAARLRTRMIEFLKARQAVPMVLDAAEKTPLDAPKGM